MRVINKEGLTYLHQATEVSAVVEVSGEDAILRFSPVPYPIWLANDSKHYAYELPAKVRVELPVEKIEAATRRWNKDFDGDLGHIIKLTGEVRNSYHDIPMLQATSVVWSAGKILGGAGACSLFIPLR